ncbi:cytochrome-c oxidase, cbb3-type subunit III [Rhabdochromatium marinum]|uniref:cytochrome-c oxidase, cbb3-type subunit III n=1 Tax=Rhabdochromatium marinum TaxID=48729 RepID=UPI001908D121|nr:cytochrome-c oxidase, cbb3-type subunit III [Rhabdochromatium marinum]MBK1650461.1 cytochrome-c oxidase, cbb3-type subunit III [Rhabdochromatium marinum]
MADTNPFPGENNTGHFWDDNLRELKNPPPRWWMIAFWLSLAWWVLYGLLYPMWPTPPWKLDETDQEFTQGMLDWSSIKEFERGMAQVEEVRAEYDQRIAAMSAEEILDDPGLLQYTLASSKVLFGDYCAACHGSGGQGNPGYPVLADNDWLYGGTLSKIIETITGGRKGNMIAHEKILSEQEVDTLANFVVNLSKGQPGSEEAWALFRGKGCTGCHGAEATGVIATLPNGSIVTVGAANLTDTLWRFRPGGYESAKHTILYGVNQTGVEQTRNAVMPAFGGAGSAEGRLDAEQIKKLAVYVHELGGGQ